MPEQWRDLDEIRGDRSCADENNCGEVDLGPRQKSRMLYASYFGFAQGGDAVPQNASLGAIKVRVRSKVSNHAVGSIIVDELRLVKPPRQRFANEPVHPVQIVCSKSRTASCRRWKEDCRFYSRFIGTAKQWGFPGRWIADPVDQNTFIKENLLASEVRDFRFGVMFRCRNKSGDAGAITCSVNAVQMIVHWFVANGELRETRRWTTFVDQIPRP
jgi:hypothetical protein